LFNIESITPVLHFSSRLEEKFGLIKSLELDTSKGLFFVLTNFSFIVVFSIDANFRLHLATALIQNEFERTKEI